jgi:hypothetical protein
VHCHRRRPQNRPAGPERLGVRAREDSNLRLLPPEASSTIAYMEGLVDEVKSQHELERRTVDATGDDAFVWTREVETALDITALRRDDPADLN